jgi:uncharacterized protein (TIGR02145 family)
MGKALLKLLPLMILGLVLLGCRNLSVKDVDGNRYNTVKIGNQVWMSENLRTTRYNDGTAIPLATRYRDWADLSGPAYCWYNNDSTHKEVYGALYNWHAVQTGKLCPEGWHVATDEEWNDLQSYLLEEGNEEHAGNALKEAGTAHWRNPNADASNSSGFNALPGGYRDYLGPFNMLRADGYWWTSTESNWYNPTDSVPKIAFYRNLHYKDPDLQRSATYKSFGFCVRCLMDE